jgi:hypothetical protein
MIEIRKEAEEIISGKQPKDNNLLKNAPHPISVIVSSEEDWKRFVLFSPTTNSQESQSNHPDLIPVSEQHFLYRGYVKRSSGHRYHESTMVRIF